MVWKLPEHVLHVAFLGPFIVDLRIEKRPLPTTETEPDFVND
jgi:hypothetical protein